MSICFGPRKTLTYAVGTDGPGTGWRPESDRSCGWVAPERADSTRLGLRPPVPTEVPGSAVLDPAGPAWSGPGSNTYLFMHLEGIMCASRQRCTGEISTILNQLCAENQHHLGAGNGTCDLVKHSRRPNPRSLGVAAAVSCYWAEKPVLGCLHRCLPVSRTHSIQQTSYELEKKEKTKKKKGSLIMRTDYGANVRRMHFAVS